MEDEETTLAGKGFWTHDRIVFAIILLVGAIIGGIITHNYIDPRLSGPVRLICACSSSIRCSLLVIGKFPVVDFPSRNWWLMGPLAVPWFPGFGFWILRPGIKS